MNEKQTDLVQYTGYEELDRLIIGIKALELQWKRNSIKFYRDSGLLILAYIEEGHPWNKGTREAFTTATSYHRSSLYYMLKLARMTEEEVSNVLDRYANVFRFGNKIPLTSNGEPMSSEQIEEQRLNKKQHMIDKLANKHGASSINHKTFEGQVNKLWSLLNGSNKSEYTPSETKALKTLYDMLQWLFQDEGKQQ